MIKIKLITNSPQEFQASKKKVKTLRCIIFILSFIYMSILLVYFLIENKNSNLVKRDILSPFFIGARFVKVMIDFFVEILFVFLLLFFLKYRKAHTEKHNLSLYNYTVLITILLLFFLSVAQSLLIFVQTYD